MRGREQEPFGNQYRKKVYKEEIYDGGERSGSDRENIYEEDLKKRVHDIFKANKGKERYPGTKPSADMPPASPARQEPTTAPPALERQLADAESRARTAEANARGLEVKLT